MKACTDNFWWVVWFKDGYRETFTTDDMPEFAARFDFCADDALSKKDIDLIDKDGDLIGGVYCEQG